MSAGTHCFPFVGAMSKLSLLDAKPRAILAPLATEQQGSPRITSVGRRASYGGSTLASSQVSCHPEDEHRNVAFKS